MNRNSKGSRMDNLSFLICFLLKTTIYGCINWYNHTCTVHYGLLPCVTVCCMVNVYKENFPIIKFCHLSIPQFFGSRYIAFVQRV